MARIHAEKIERRKGIMVKVLAGIILSTVVLVGTIALTQSKDAAVTPASASPVARYEGTIPPLRQPSLVYLPDGQLGYQYPDGTLVGLDGSPVATKAAAQAVEAASTPAPKYDGLISPAKMLPRIVQGPDGQLAYDYPDGMQVYIDSGELIRAGNAALTPAQKPVSTTAQPAQTPATKEGGVMFWYEGRWAVQNADGSITDEYGTRLQ